MNSKTINKITNIKFNNSHNNTNSLINYTPVSSLISGNIILDNTDIKKIDELRKWSVSHFKEKTSIGYLNETKIANISKDTTRFNSKLDLMVKVISKSSLDNNILFYVQDESDKCSLIAPKYFKMIEVDDLIRIRNAVEDLSINNNTLNDINTNKKLKILDFTNVIIMPKKSYLYTDYEYRLYINKKEELLLKKKNKINDNNTADVKDTESGKQVLNKEEVKLKSILNNNNIYSTFKPINLPHMNINTLGTMKELSDLVFKNIHTNTTNIYSENIDNNYVVTNIYSIDTIKLNDITYSNKDLVKGSLINRYNVNKKNISDNENKQMSSITILLNKKRVITKENILKSNLSISDSIFKSNENFSFLTVINLNNILNYINCSISPYQNKVLNSLYRKSPIAINQNSLNYIKNIIFDYFMVNATVLAIEPTNISKGIFRQCSNFKNCFMKVSAFEIYLLNDKQNCSLKNEIFKTIHNNNKESNSLSCNVDNSLNISNKFTPNKLGLYCVNCKSENIFYYDFNLIMSLDLYNANVFKVNLNTFNNDEGRGIIDITPEKAFIDSSLLETYINDKLINYLIKNTYCIELPTWKIVGIYSLSPVNQNK